MNRNARDKVLRIVGVIMVVLLPVMLALWFAQQRAINETSSQLRSFAKLALDKTELVIQQVELAPWMGAGSSCCRTVFGRYLHAGTPTKYVEYRPGATLHC